MNPHALDKLKGRYQDLMSRARLMRASGYHASADELLRLAWGCADAIAAASLHAVISATAGPGHEGRSHAKP